MEPRLHETKGFLTDSLDIYTIFSAAAFEEADLEFNLQQSHVE